MVNAFDAARYERLMNGLEAVEMRLSEVMKEQFNPRFDSEYFQKKYLIEEKNRSHYENKLLQELSFITDGQHGYHEIDEQSNIHFLTAKNAKNWFADVINADKVAKWVDDKNKRSSLKVNDIILSTRGTVGFCAIVKDDILPAQIDQDIARIFIHDRTILSEFLLTYLNSKYGQDWMKRNQTGMVQQGLSLQRVRELPIPILTTSFQENIKQVIISGHHKLNQSKWTYCEAETLLLIELGLHNWQPSKANTEIKTFKNSFLQSGRLDAEYYQPKYDQIKEKILQYGHFKLKDIFAILSSLSPSYYTDNGTKVIKTKNIRVPSVDINQIEDCTNEKVLLIKRNDLLFASMGVGSLGRMSFVETELENYTIDGTIKLFRTKKEIENSFKEIPTLLFLTSTFGQELIYKYVIGSTGIISISKEDVENLIIPNVKEDVAKQLTHLVLESQNLKKQSQHLLNIAKQAVEMAIEESEEAAMTWIEKQMV